MKFKVLKKVDKGCYEVTCPLPMSFLDWVRLSVDLEKSKERYYKNRLILEVYGLREGKNVKEVLGVVTIWDGLNKFQKNLLTPCTVLDIDKHFLEMSKEKTTCFEMYISVDLPGGIGTAD